VQPGKVAPLVQHPKYQVTADGLLPEHTFKSTYKLKAMSLLKLIPGKGWAKVYETPELYLSKVVQGMDETAYIIGGAKDKLSQTTVKDVIAIRIGNQGKIEKCEKTPMNTSRSSFGSVINVNRNEIYVAGGYVNGQLTKSCEAYSIKDNKWRELPPLNESKCSVTLCVLGSRFLYCFGGLSRQAENAYLLSSIEMLDLQADEPRWVMQSIKMPNQVCDLGAIPINENEIVLFGGWNKQALNVAFTMKQTKTSQDYNHSFGPVHGGLGNPDFFMIHGVAMANKENPHIVKISGHSSLFTFNLKTRMFEGHANA
jgi:Kelch motif